MSTLCPRCGSKVLPGDAACPNCHAALSPAKPDTAASPHNPYSSPVDIHAQDAMGGSYVLWLLFSPRGRVPRRVMWVAGIAVNGAMYLYIFAVLSVFEIPFDKAPLGDATSLRPIVNLAITIPNLLRVWIQLMISVKRCHDRGHSGWWVLWGFVPCVGGMILLVDLGFLPSMPGSNEYGQDPTDDALRGRLPPEPDYHRSGSRKLPDKLQLPTASMEPPVRRTIQCPFCDATVAASDDVEVCPHCNRPLL